MNLHARPPTSTAFTLATVLAIIALGTACAASVDGTVIADVGADAVGAGDGVSDGDGGHATDIAQPDSDRDVTQQPPDPRNDADVTDLDEHLGDGADDGILDMTGGLLSINGLSTTNGLRSGNGLSTSNGMHTINGMHSLNGMQTSNGLRSLNGYREVNGVQVAAVLHVDCTGRVLNTMGGYCTGEADGLFSATTGLLRDQAGLNTAKYVVRCALPSGKSIRLKRWDGELETFHGQIGLAPEWLASDSSNGRCDVACQEKVSACLLAHTNGLGVPLALELSSPDMAIGTGHSSGFPYQEAVFYGNLFVEPPAAFAAMGADYTVPRHPKFHAGAQRACRGQGGHSDAFCPIRLHPISGNNVYCNMSATGTATWCRDPKDSNVYRHPITTYRQYKTNELEPNYNQVAERMGYSYQTINYL